MIIHSRSWSAITVLAFMALTLIVLISKSARAAGPWYVAPGGSDSNSCLVPAAPCATINGAIGKASSDDTIYVATGTYTNTSGTEVVLIDKSITLSGGWDATFTIQSGVSTIDGEAARGGIAVGTTVGSGVTTIIERFVVQNGSLYGGGGIYNWSTLTLNNSMVSDNAGSGIYNNGTLILNNSVVSANVGSGIYNGVDFTGNLTLNNSTISGNSGGDGGIFNKTGSVTLNNSAITGNDNHGLSNHDLMVINNSTVSSNAGGEGGGIYNWGGAIITLNNSTVSSNRASYGGGIYNRGTLLLIDSTITGNTGNSEGGGISNKNGTVTLNNSTVSGNTSQFFGSIGGGGIFNYGGILTLNNSTISGNSGESFGSGGISNYLGTVTLQNSILAGNTSAGTGPDCNGVISSSGYNLIGSTAVCTFNATTGDLLDVNAKLFPSLVGLPGYHPLLPGSPAINAGNPGGCTDNLGNPLNTDQRGIARVGRCDIGAYEYDPAYDPLTYVFLPLISKPRPGIQGLVTLNGDPIVGVSLELRFFDGSSWSTLAITTTGADGYYTFLNTPGLDAGQKYYVRYLNDLGTGGRLWVWATRELTSYSAGSAVIIGDFDIADIALVSPTNGATVALPYTFQWTPRPATLLDTYEFDLYDPTDGDPYFYTAPPLGYVGSYTLNGLPAGFSSGVQYGWEIWVYSPDGGYGISYETRSVMFSNTGFGMVPPQSILLKPTQLVEDSPEK